MRSAWHRSEQRDVRPFFETVRAQDAVVGTTVRFFEDEEPTADAMTDIEEPDLARLQPVIFPVVVPPGQWMPEDYQPDEFGLVILATNPFLKFSSIIHEVTLGQETPAEVAISSEALEELGGGRGLTITVAIHLRSDRIPSAGRPFVVGHWLARKDFTIRLPGTGRFFDVQPRNDEDWIQAGYPAKTLYVVDYHGGVCDETTETDSSIATVYVHSGVHNKITNDRLGEGIQKFLATEVIVQVLQDSIDDWKDLDTVVVRSPLAALLKNLDSGNPMSISDLRSLVDGGRRKKLRALLQNDMSIVRALT